MPDAEPTDAAESSPPPAGYPRQTSVPDTLISVTFALAMAFLFRVYVIEAFVIPTGSMAPTLLGAHYKVHSPSTGAVFMVDRRLTDSSRRGQTVGDPYTDEDLPTSGLTRLDGDRIFVRKRTPLSPLPDRYDVVVFRSPTDPDERVIKRLVGRPGEQIALVDGDVFVRDAEGTEPGRPTTWHEQGWTIARKPERAQRAVWQPVHDAARVTDFGPWVAETEGWSAEAGTFRYSGSGTTSLHWDTSAWEIRDRSPYNDIDERRDQRLGSGGVRSGLSPSYPVSDLRVRFGFEPEGSDDSLAVVIVARSHEFRVSFDRTGSTLAATIELRPKDSDHWITLGSGETRINDSRVTELDVWHADQAITVFAGGTRFARAEYNWSIAQRLASSIPGASLDALSELDEGLNRLSDSEQYQRPGIRFDISGEASLHRVRIDRDIYYHPHHAQYRPKSNPPPLGTHPITTVTLGKSQLWVLGDNSPASRDGRTWGQPDAWVKHAYPDTAAEGVLPVQMLVGEPFLVYFPALHRDKRIPVPDLGRVRRIN